MFSKIVIAIVLVVVVSASAAAAQTKSGRSGGSVATAYKLERIGDSFLNKLYITVGGRRWKVADSVLAAWIVDNGRNVVYSMRDGAGGYENEGESLRIYNVATRKTRKILAEYYSIIRVTDVRLKTGKIALLVEMQDGGLGAEHFAVADSARGQVFRRQLTALAGRNGDIIALATYKADDWGVLNEGTEAEKKSVKPSKTERLNLNAILKRPVIVNRREPR